MKPNCDRCTLPGISPVWGQGRPGGLVVVSDAPSAGTPLGRGAADKLLRIATQEAGWGDSPLFATCLTMCRPPAAQKEPSELEVECCSERLKHEVLAAKPTHILLLGTKVTKALLGKGINKSRGQLVELWGIPTIATYHPSYMLNQPEAYKDFVWDITKLREKQFVDYLPEAKRHTKIVTEADALYMISKISGKVALDIETAPAHGYGGVQGAGLNPRTNIITRIGLYDDTYGALVLKGDALTKQVVEAIANKQDIGIICHNADFEYRNLRYHYGVQLPIAEDTMLMHHAIDERAMDSTSARSHPVARNLKTLGRLYFDLDDWSEGVSFIHDDLELDDYLAIDVWVTRHLRDKLYVELVEEEQEFPFYEITMPVRKHLSEMTHRGMYIDREYLQQLDYEFGVQIERLEQEIQDIAPQAFNPQSPRELAHVLFDVMGLPRYAGNSTARNVLEALSEEIGGEYNLADMMIEFRKLNKLHGTYVQGLASAVDVDGKIRGKFNQHRTTTYRLSSDDPNLQNIPSTRTKLGRLIRNVFVSPENHSFLEIDYSQIEVFVMALVANDPVLQQVLGDGDIYKHMASRFYGVSYADVTKEQRTRMKPVVLGALYDRRASAIAMAEGMDVGEVQQKLDVFFNEFSMVRAYLDRQPRIVFEDGYVQSLFGRRRRFPMITADNKLDVARQAINAPVQGSACDIVLMALMRIEEKYGYMLETVLQIHDSLTYYVHDNDKEEAIVLATREMTKDPLPNIPLKFRVEATWGKKWGDLHEVV